MNEENEREKITLPKDLQIEMLKFFLKTSIPRKKQQQACAQSEHNSERGD